MSRQPPAQQPPPVQRLRLRYAKRGRARFASHRDFSRAFERTLRRADVPMAFSSGFSPHPRISYVNAAPTGAASEAEYLEIGLAERRAPDDLRDRLNAALPDGFVIVAVVEAAGAPLPAMLTHSQWLMSLPGVGRDDLAAGVEAFAGAVTVPVERMTKNGARTLDVRGAVVSLGVGETGCLDLVSVMGVPLVRPGDVAQGLAALWPACAPSDPGVFTRLAQGPLRDGLVENPF